VLCPVELNRLTRRFAPLVRFHPEEGFFPSSVPWFLKRVALWHVSSPMHAKRPSTITPVLAKGKVDSVSLVDQRVGNDRSGGSSKGLFYLDIPDDSERARTCMGYLPTAKCYVHVQPASSGKWHLAYLFFYPFNGAIAIDKKITHEGDWEHIKIEVDTTGSNIVRVFFSAHAGGQWQTRYSTSQGNTDGFRCSGGTHPIVYSARHSHASYPKSGRQSRPTVILPDDHCGSGIEWRTWEALEILGDKANPPAGQEWLKFNGHWGEYRGSIYGEIVEGPTGPAFKKWWKDNGSGDATG
jgi:hypothetical protein